MIDRDRFEVLAGAVSSGEASPEEHAEFYAALAADPALAREWDSTEAVDLALHAAARSGTEETPPIPAALLAQLAEVRRVGENVVVPTVLPLPPGHERLTGRKVTRLLALAAAFVLLLGLAIWWGQRPAASVPASAILAPRGETAFTQPTLVWDAQPKQRYDVWILPRDGDALTAKAIGIALDQVPPVAFAKVRSPQAPDVPATLQAGADYRLLVCPAGTKRIGGAAVPFRTAPFATGTPPTPSLEAARQLSAADHTADALMVLALLPGEERRQTAAHTLETDLRARLLPGGNPAP